MHSGLAAKSHCSLQPCGPQDTRTLSCSIVTPPEDILCRIHKSLSDSSLPAQQSPGTPAAAISALVADTAYTHACPPVPQGPHPAATPLATPRPSCMCHACKHLPPPESRLGSRLPPEPRRTCCRDRPARVHAAAQHSVQTTPPLEIARVHRPLHCRSTTGRNGGGRCVCAPWAQVSGGLPPRGLPLVVWEAIGGSAGCRLGMWHVGSALVHTLRGRVHGWGVESVGAPSHSQTDAC